MQRFAFECGFLFKNRRIFGNQIFFISPRTFYLSEKPTVAQIAQEVNAGSDEKVSEYTVYHSLLCMGQGAHADPCPLPKAATVGTWASELDHGAMEECGLVWCITFSFTSLGWPGACCLPGESGCTMGKRQAGEGSDALGDVLLGNLGSCHVHVDATLTCSTYLSIVANHVHHGNSISWWLWPLSAG